MGTALRRETGTSAPTSLFNGTVVDPVRSRQRFASIFTAFPDFHRTKEDTIAEGDKVVARHTATGTHHGEYVGVPATGKKVKFSWIAEEWWVFDQLGLLQQLGAVKSFG